MQHYPLRRSCTSLVKPNTLCEHRNGSPTHHLQLVHFTLKWQHFVDQWAPCLVDLGCWAAPASCCWAAPCCSCQQLGCCGATKTVWNAAGMPQVCRWEGMVPAAAGGSPRGWFAEPSQGGFSAMEEIFPLIFPLFPLQSAPRHQLITSQRFKAWHSRDFLHSWIFCAGSKHRWSEHQSPLFLADPQLQEQPQGGCFYSEWNRAISDTQELICLNK